MTKQDPYDYDYDWFHLNYSLESKDYYGVLGVAQTSTAAQIKTAFNKLALRLHPHKNNGSKQAEEAFKTICTAQEVLCDTLRRAQYDQDLQIKSNYLDIDAHFEEIRQWSIEEAERQRAKERAAKQTREEGRERRAYDNSPEGEHSFKKGGKRATEAENERKSADTRDREEHVDEALRAEHAALAEKKAAKAGEAKAEAEKQDNIKVMLAKKAKTAKKFEKERARKKSLKEERERKMKEQLKKREQHRRNRQMPVRHGAEAWEQGVLR